MNKMMKMKKMTEKNDMQRDKTNSDMHIMSRKKSEMKSEKMKMKSKKMKMKEKIK